MENGLTCELCDKEYNIEYESDWLIKIKSLFKYGMPFVCMDCLRFLFHTRSIDSGDVEQWKKVYGEQEFLDNNLDDVIVVYRTQQNMIGRVKTKSKLNLIRRDTFRDIFIEEQDDLVICTEKGRVSTLQLSDIPISTIEDPLEIHISDLMEIEEGEGIVSFQSVNRKEIDFLLVTTKHGYVSKFPVEILDNKDTMVMIDLKKNDRVSTLSQVKHHSNICLISRNGNAIVFQESEITPSNKKTAGVKGMSLQRTESFNPKKRVEDDMISALIITNMKAEMIAVTTQYGYGFRFPVSSLRIQQRGGKGKPIINITEKNGEIIHAELVKQDEEVLYYFLTCNNHIYKMIRDLPKLKAGIQGVTLVRLHNREQDRFISCYPITINRLVNVIHHTEKEENKQIIISKVKEFHQKLGIIPTSDPKSLIPQLKKEEYISVLKFYRGLTLRGEIKFLIGNWYQVLADAGLIEFEKIGKYGIVCVAKDGHVCRSLQEKFIDDWLYEYGIKHETEPVYPYHIELNKNSMRADFKVGDTWIEYFGLTTKKYKEKMDKKRELAKLESIHLIELFPEDMTREKLEQKLGFLI
jgi:hypothetical protein